ncbi:TetR/AcrR family transcriptional regulator [Tsukamurella sp. PLM1]|uniref:TetR/AcrR family transcriptional regulator n=1 Tax=Tsukamurella sp. PLM1 TaxID=2929795 RepID=UPI002052A26F|nr:TetR/AcrR family transcriptional regulator [Tsukamurella sp. PLM1]BDH58853.1 putative transcriptional regulator, TetR family protein [Tsukamurella sp. PLM1]
MGRPTLHDPDQLLDAAVRLFAREGARGLTVAAVAREAKAPSGSVYHRFPDRQALLAAVWLRTVRSFHDAYVREFADVATAREAMRSARWIVERCRAELGEVLVLQAGEHAFGADSWSQAAVDEWAALSAERDATTSAIVRRVAAESKRPRADVAFALYDLPLAVVRRHLLAGEAPPGGAAGLAERLAGRILGVEDDRGGR